MKGLQMFQTFMLAVQFMCLVMMVFFAWLGTKMALPNGITDWWNYANMICMGVHFLVAGVWFLIDKRIKRNER